MYGFIFMVNEFSYMVILIKLSIFFLWDMSMNTYESSELVSEITINGDVLLSLLDSLTGWLINLCLVVSEVKEQPPSAKPSFFVIYGEPSSKEMFK
jgi:hypothetical protein